MSRRMGSRGNPHSDRAARQRLPGFIRRHQQCLVVLLICAAAVGGVWHRTWDYARDRQTADLDAGADHIAADVSDQLAEYTRLLRTARSLFIASDRVTRADWAIFTRSLDLQAQAPGLLALGFIARVEPADLAPFVEEARADGMPEFRVRPHPQADRNNDGEPSFIALYSEPLERNRAIIGIDLATNQRNRQVYLDSAEARDVRVLAGLQLVQGCAGSDGLVAALPVRHPGPDGPLLGWVTATIDLSVFLEAACNQTWDGYRVVAHLDPAGDWGATAALGDEPGADTPPGLSRDRTVNLFGRPMRLHVTPVAGGPTHPDMAEANSVLVIGSLSTALLTLITWSATRTRQRALSIARQMTESLRVSEQRQRELAERAEQASRAKSEFLANMSHEIRTPMTAILGYAAIVEGREVDDAGRTEAVRAIHRAGRHLLTIINDVLDLSKIESGHMRVVQEPCDPGSIVGEVATALRAQAASKGLELSVRLEGQVPDRVLTDPHRVRQILLNLVGNAVKFTERGGIEVVLSHRVGRLIIEVHDTGIGIDPEKLELVFRPFEQADNSATRRHEGTGLGLTISRRLAALLGGELTARSRVGRGSVFTLDIPALPGTGARALTEIAPPPPVEPPRAPERLMGARVLLAEDGPDNQKLIGFILRRAGLTVDVVSNGREAVERLSSDPGYDLVITDMQMPEMDGYAAVRALRQNGFDRPVIALTAHAMEGDRERCLAAGCDDYEPKPVDRASLLAKIDRLLRERPDAGRAEAA